MSLEVRDLRVSLGGQTVLAGITAAFEAGQVTAILGPNGAGKSTLLAALAGLSRPEAGEVTLDGAPILSLASRDRARRLGFIPQTPELAWAVDVETLVGLGRIPFTGARGLGVEDEVAVGLALQACGVADLARRDVTTLSGGERARVLLARALAGDPAWLLADEPLAGLDPGHALDACALFRRLARDEGRGVILTLHDLPLAARLADRILVLAQGRILADGPPAEALAPPVLEAAYGVRARLAEGDSGLVVEVLGRAG